MNAECKLHGSIPTCACAKGRIGNPFVACDKFFDNACNPKACGGNATCRLGHERIFPPFLYCTCLKGFTADDKLGCIKTTDCQLNEECADNETCKNSVCTDSCKGECGTNAVCEAKRETVTCTCPLGSSGNPHESCEPIRFIKTFVDFGQSNIFHV